MAQPESERDTLPDLPAAREWILDGFNVLHACFFPDGNRSDWWAEHHRARLLERAGAFAAPSQRQSAVGDGALADRETRATAPWPRVWVIFDGDRPPAGPPGDSGTPRVVFAPSADAWIVGRVRSARHPDQLAIVTLDRQVAGRVRHRGAHVVSPGDFLAHCGSTQEELHA